MRIRDLLGLSGVGLALALTGCGDDGGMMMMDAGDEWREQRAANRGVEFRPLPEAQYGEVSSSDPQRIESSSAMSGDYSCLGSRTKPSGGSEVSFTLTIEAFQSGDPQPDLCVEFYDDNMIPAGGGSCSGMTTDAMGQLTEMAPEGGWYAYRVFPNSDQMVVGSVQKNEVAPGMGGNSVGNAIKQGTIDLIPTVLGFERADGTAIVTGTVVDCGGNPIYGTEIRVAKADGTYVTESAMPKGAHYRYFDGNDFPNGSQPWSHVDGLYAVGNVPVASAGAQVFVEVWGRTEAGGELKVLGCERTPVFGDTLSILNVGPTRMDGPSCPGLE